MCVSSPLTFENCFFHFHLSLSLSLSHPSISLQYAPEKVQKILVGNKSDEVDKRQVATEQGVKVRKAVRFLY